MIMSPRCMLNDLYKFCPRNWTLYYLILLMSAGMLKYLKQ